MKRLLSLCLILLAFSLSMPARTFVLAVGVSNYYGYQNDLNQTTKDAKMFKKVMETQTKDITLLTSKYANKANIMEKLRAICNRAQKGDRIIFYFSGHGGPGGICASDAFLNYSDLVDLLETSDAGAKICFIDACHSGSVADDKNVQASKSAKSLSAATKGKNDQVFFVGCRGDEYSYEDPWVGAGYFTQALVKGLRGKCDSNADKKITTIELFKYIYNDVVKRSNSGQHPQLIAPESMQNAVIAVWK